MRPGRVGHRLGRLTFLTLGLVSLLMLAIPAQAGLGDLLSGLLNPVEDLPVVGDVLDPVVQAVVVPLVQDVVAPVTGALVDPIVDQILPAPVTTVTTTPTVTTVTTTVEPPVDEVVTPVVDPVVPPLIEPVKDLVPPAPTTTITAPAAIDRLRGIEEPPEPVRVTSSTVSTSNGSALRPTVPTGRESLQAALLLQTALAESSVLTEDDGSLALSTEGTDTESAFFERLTDWLRNNSDQFLSLIALPIRFLELLTRALLTAGSGLIAPVSMLLAVTSYLIKDRRWGLSAIKSQVRAGY